MKRILVVDDSEALVEDLVELFEYEGHAVRHASDGLSALQHAKGFPFHVALVDARMPRMDGISVVRHLATERPCALYLFMSGYRSDRALSEAMALTGRAVLDKPLDLTRIQQLVAAST